MRIIDRIEPETSLKNLKKYELKYRINSFVFYTKYQEGIMLIDDQYEAALGM